MEATQTGSKATTKQQVSDKLFLENTLLRVSGVLFCHDPKSAGARTEPVELNADGAGRRVVIRPDPRLGQPGQLAHKVFVALLKKHSDYGRPVQKEISFTKREIMRLIGRKTWGGSDSEQLSRALHEIHHTFVTASFRAKDGRFVEHSFNIFPEILLERREFASDPIERCTITLAEPIVSSLRDDHFTCLNHALMVRLGTIGQAIYMRLFFHFANLYDGRDRGRLVFHKRYEDICGEWLGGLTVLGHRSRIIGQQLGTHLDQLVTERFLASYTVSAAKAGDGFVIAFRPGEAFYADYERFYRRRRQGELQFTYHEDQRETSEPLRVAYLFASKRFGLAAENRGFATSKDVEAGRQLLSRLAMSEMPAFIDYALAEARKTAFDVQTLSGIKQYMAGYLASKRERASEAARERQQRLQQRREEEELAYERARRAAAEELFRALTPAEQAEIDARANTYGGKLRGDMARLVSGRNKVRAIIELHSDKLPSFDAWRQARKAA
jgi:hypothetical protein